MKKYFKCVCPCIQSDSDENLQVPLNPSWTESNASSFTKTVAFVGPRQSGKSSLIYYLKNDEIMKQCKSTEQIEQKEVIINNKKFDIKEVPHFSKDLKADAFVYVFDSSSSQDFSDFNKFQTQIYSKVPVLLFLNKSDLIQYSLDTSQIK